MCEKARKTNEALPHTAEGYNRATAILKDQFGKECEIVKCFVKEIMELPYIPTANVNKIHEFHDKSACCVQSLETMEQLDAENGTVSTTLENYLQSGDISPAMTTNGKLNVHSTN